MAPAFPGPEIRLECPECHDRFSLAVDPPSPLLTDPNQRESTGIRWVTCPSCGFSEIRVDDLTNAPSSPKVLHSTLSTDQICPPSEHPRRWDPVLFVPDPTPAEPAPKGTGKRVFRPAGLKRVVGLPGESIEIHGGDLYVQGKIVTKPDPRFAMVPLPSVEPVRSPDRVLFQNRTPIPWLTGEEPSGKTPTPITNAPCVPRLQPIPSDRRENVRDFYLFLPAPFLQVATSPIRILANQGDRFWLLTLNINEKTGRVRSLPNPEPERGEEGFLTLGESSFASSPEKTIPLDSEPGGILFAVVDREALLGRLLPKDESTAPTENKGNCSFLTESTGWKELGRIPENRQEEELEGSEIPPITTPFALLSPLEDAIPLQGPDAPRVFRDIHYSTPEGKISAWTLGADDYLLLGDNSAVSIDARDGSPPPLSGDRLRVVR